MVWRDKPALRGGGFGFLLGYNWIKKGGGIAVVLPLGCWGVIIGGCSFSQCYLLPVAVGSWSVLFLFPVISSPGDKLRRIKWQSCLTRS